MQQNYINDTLNFSIEGVNCSYPNIWNITTLNNSANNSIGLINLTLTLIWYWLLFLKVAHHHK